MKRLFILVLGLAFVGCTNMQVADLDANTGRFPGNKVATVVTSKSVELDEKKALLVVPTGGFSAGMLKNVGFFDEVLTVQELEAEIIKADLTDEVASLRDRIGLNRAAKAYRPFLWLHWDDRTEGGKKFAQLKLTDPLTLEDYFVTETYLDHVWAGVNDQNNWYPMMNALLEYIESNSTTYGSSEAD